MLAGLTFEVPEGNVCALVGPSGGGKSTAMHLVLRYYDPTDGALSLGGMPYSSLNFPSMHARIGTVSQETQLLSVTATEANGIGQSPPAASRCLSSSPLLLTVRLSLGSRP